VTEKQEGHPACKKSIPLSSRGSVLEKVEVENPLLTMFTWVPIYRKF